MTPAERLIMVSDYFGKNEREIILEICEENKRLREALKIAREYVSRVDGTMAFTAPENRLTKPDLDIINKALKE